MATTQHVRILILGPPGSGKTTLGKKLAKSLNIPYYDTDDILWVEKFSKKRDKPQCKTKIAKISNSQSWIIGGTAKSWVSPAEERATEILVLQTSFLKCCIRIPKRYLLRKGKYDESVR